jgi:hypothetical protein
MPWLSLCADWLSAHNYVNIYFGTKGRKPKKNFSFKQFPAANHENGQVAFTPEQPKAQNQPAPPGQKYSLSLPDKKSMAADFLNGNPNRKQQIPFLFFHVYLCALNGGSQWEPGLPLTCLKDG